MSYTLYLGVMMQLSEDKAARATVSEMYDIVCTCMSTLAIACALQHIPDVRSRARSLMRLGLEVEQVLDEVLQLPDLTQDPPQSAQIEQLFDRFQEGIQQLRVDLGF